MHATIVVTLTESCSKWFQQPVYSIESKLQNNLCVHETMIQIITVEYPRARTPLPLVDKI
jgi:hypothetical protein